MTLLPDPCPPPVSALACLTLLLPRALEDRVVDWLLTHTDGQTEFSVHPVAARGPLVRLAADEERVLGFAQRVEVKLITHRPALALLLGPLTQLLQGVEGGYWVLPVERFASFPAAPTAPAAPTTEARP